MKGVVDIEIVRASGVVERYRRYNQIQTSVFTSLRNKSNPDTGTGTTYSSNYVPTKVKMLFANGAELVASVTPTLPDHKIIFKTGPHTGSAFDPDTNSSTISAIALLSASDSSVAIASSSTAGDWSSTSNLSATVGNDDTITVVYTLSFLTASGTNGGAWNNNVYVNHVRDVVAGSFDWDLSVKTVLILTADGGQIDSLPAATFFGTTSNDTVAGTTVSASWKANASWGSLTEQPQHLEIRDAYGNTISRYDISGTWSSATFEAGDGISLTDYEFGFAQTVT